MTQAWKPNKKQEFALRQVADELLYGGARGGGKTDAGIAWLTYPIQNPNYKALILRRNYTDLHDWLSRAGEAYQYIGGKVVNSNEIRFPSGATFHLGHLADDKSYMKYQGHEYQRILIEELTQIPTEEMYLKVLSSNRSTVEGLPARAFLTCNPGGPGHGWVKRRFVDPAPPMQKFSVNGRSRIFVPATVFDNTVLMEKDPGYVKMLEMLPDDLKAQWLRGSWEIQKVKGAYFADDMIKAQEQGRIGMYPYNETHPVYAAYDIGLNDTMVCWYFQFFNNQIRIIDLHADNDKSFDHYRLALQESGYRIEAVFLPHDGVKRGQDTLRSFQDVLNEAGYATQVQPRTKDKMADINLCRTNFNRVVFNEQKCLTGIEALTIYRRKYDEVRAVYLDTPFHDWTSHYADAFMVAMKAVDGISTKENSGQEGVDEYLQMLHYN